MKKASIRFYEELNDFLPAKKRKVRFEHRFFGNPSIKDFVESLGVPHPEIDLIMVNGNSVGFNYQINDGDDIAVYPVFESFDISSLQKLRPMPLRQPKFVLDVHLGALARYLRILGMDVLYENHLGDREIIAISIEQKRAILTRDIGILKHSKVTHGYFVRNIDPQKQVSEVLKRFDLIGQIKEFTRCLECNSILKPIAKEAIIDRLPEKVREHYDDYSICTGCNRIYWAGTHYHHLRKKIEEIISNTSG